MQVLRRNVDMCARDGAYFREKNISQQNQRSGSHLGKVKTIGCEATKHTQIVRNLEMNVIEKVACRQQQQQATGTLPKYISKFPELVMFTDTQCELPLKIYNDM